MVVTSQLTMIIDHFYEKVAFILKNIKLFFSVKDVPILHLIPSPFPSVWHNQQDTVENLFENHIQDMRKIMKFFLMEILNVNI